MPKLNLPLLMMSSMATFFGNQHGVMQRQDNNRGADADVPGASGDRAQEGPDAESSPWREKRCSPSHASSMPASSANCICSRAWIKACCWVKSSW